MLDLKILAAGNSDADVVDAFYYVTRYLKQAEHILKEYKDIFEDEERSSPIEAVRSLANRIIEAIETYEGKSILQLEDKKCMDWIFRITEMEQDIEPTFTSEEMNAGLDVLNNLEDPDLSPTR